MVDEELPDFGFAQARREESKAHNEMDYYERAANGQQEQMNALLKHKKECVNGIVKAKATGLSPVHVREFKLLMTHIDSVLETLSYKVDKSQENYEKSKETWQEKNSTFEEIKEHLRQIELEKLRTFTEEIESEQQDDSKFSGYKAIQS